MSGADLALLAFTVLIGGPALVAALACGCVIVEELLALRRAAQAREARARQLLAHGLHAGKRPAADRGNLVNRPSLKPTHDAYAKT